MLNAAANDLNKIASVHTVREDAYKTQSWGANTYVPRWQIVSDKLRKVVISITSRRKHAFIGPFSAREIGNKYQINYEVASASIATEKMTATDLTDGMYEWHSQGHICTLLVRTHGNEHNGNDHKVIRVFNSWKKRQAPGYCLAEPWCKAMHECQKPWVLFRLGMELHWARLGQAKAMSLFSTDGKTLAAATGATVPNGLFGGTAAP